MVVFDNIRSFNIYFIIIYMANSLNICYEKLAMRKNHDIEAKIQIYADQLVGIFLLKQKMILEQNLK